MDIDTILNTLPMPTAAEMGARRALGRVYTAVFLRMGPASREDEARERRFQQAHLEHLTKLQLAGKLVLNGPTLVEHDILGIGIYAAELDEARALAEADPKVRAGYLTVDAVPWFAVPARAHPS